MSEGHNALCAGEDHAHFDGISNPILMQHAGITYSVW